MIYLNDAQQYKFNPTFVCSSETRWLSFWSLLVVLLIRYKDSTVFSIDKEPMSTRFENQTHTHTHTRQAVNLKYEHWTH